MKNVLLMLLNAVLPILVTELKKFIKAMVVKAEQKFNSAKSGTDKKAYVLREIDRYIDINPEVKAKLGSDVDSKIDELIEKAVKKHINY